MFVRNDDVAVKQKGGADAQSRTVDGRDHRLFQLSEAMQEAQDLVNESTDEAINELMEQPMLASVLDAGLAAFDLSCDGIGEVT